MRRRGKRVVISFLMAKAGRTLSTTFTNLLHCQLHGEFKDLRNDPIWLP